MLGLTMMLRCSFFSKLRSWSIRLKGCRWTSKGWERSFSRWIRDYYSQRRCYFSTITRGPALVLLNIAHCGPKTPWWNLVVFPYIPPGPYIFDIYSKIVPYTSRTVSTGSLWAETATHAWPLLPQLLIVLSLTFPNHRHLLLAYPQILQEAGYEDGRSYERILGDCARWRESIWCDTYSQMIIVPCRTKWFDCQDFRLEWFKKYWNRPNTPTLTHTTARHQHAMKPASWVFTDCLSLQITPCLAEKQARGLLRIQ